MKRYSHPFADGEDEEYWAETIIKRRQNLSGTEVADKILDYLVQHVALLKKEITRHREKKDMIRWSHAVARLEWTENMIFWINSNV